MKKIPVIISVLACLSFALNHPDNYPTSRTIIAYGAKTYIRFNSHDGFMISTYQTGFNEASTFKRSYSKKKITDWTLDTISPTMIPEDRKLAYTYYKDIPGVVWIEKTFFCDETEVSNLDWIEFLHLSGYSEKHSNGNATMQGVSYNTHPQFYYFPVVNISYEDAVEYCKWRTDIVTQRYNDLQGIHKDSEEYTVFSYRLPTKEEWIRCASLATDTLTYPQMYTEKEITTVISKKDIRFLNMLGAKITEDQLKDFNKNIRKDYVINCKRTINTYLNMETPYYIWDYPSNNFGIFNIIGNVSEMIAEKGVAMGGSYRDTYEESGVNSAFTYQGPSDCVGFRCICELKWPNK